MIPNLSGNVAVVTGAGRGIGRGIALAMAASGAKVAAIARSEDQIQSTAQEIAESGGDAVAFRADISNTTEIASAFSRVEELWGQIDILVNNAALGIPIGPLWEVDFEEWRRAIDVNLCSQVLTTKLVLNGMMARQSGRIVNIASGAGARPTPYHSAYGASKVALIRTTETYAQELEPYGVKVFVMAPGMVRTDLEFPITRTEIGQRWMPGFEARAIATAVPVDIPAQLCVRLASGEADALSGRFIDIRDDLDEMIANSERVIQDELYALRIRKLS